MKRRPTAWPLHVLSLAGALTACGGPEARVEPPPPPGPPSPAASAPAAPARAYPPAPRRPVVDELHGVKIADDYRWLEDAKSDEVKAWIVAQNGLTRSLLDALPDRPAIAARLRELLGAETPKWFELEEASGQLFALESRPPRQQPFIVVMKGPHPSAERVVVDPNALDPSGSTAIDFYVPSHDGKKVAVSLSRGGSESGTLHVFDVATGKQIGEPIPRVNGGTAGGSVAWTEGDMGLFYTRYPHEGERPKEDLDFYQQIYFHALGAPVARDVYAAGKDFPRNAEIELASSRDGRSFVARVQHGDGGDRSLSVYVLGPSGQWKRFASQADKVISAQLARDGKLYVISTAGAPRGKLLRVSPDKPLAAAELVVPENDAVMSGLAVTRGRLYLREIAGGPSEIRVFDHAGKALGKVPVLPVSRVAQIVAIEGDDLLFQNESFTEATGYYRFDARASTVARTALYVEPRVSFAGALVMRETCKSKDGTLVPLSVIRRKGEKRDGTGAALLTGYGGFDSNEPPRYSPLTRLWLDQGMTFALANLRGGGEFGGPWHEAGMLTRKQNVFDDFIACGEHLIEAGYAKRERLAAYGGSNGGLLMGAALTQHPDLFKAIATFSGIYDMLRNELTPNGSFNVPEYGSVKDPADFQAMIAYSPYHHVKEGTGYPATIFFSGANDPRVDPFHSRKMVARLQAATSGEAPIVLRTSGNVGHGFGTPLDERIEQWADAGAFLFHHLGVAFQPAPK